MIISWRYKFIFIHIPKCGGSSISDAFSNYFLKKEFGNNSSFRTHFKSLNKNNLEVFKNDIQYGNATYLPQHSKYSKVEMYLEKSKKNISDYFTFSFVRNPWSRCVSLYEYQYNKMDFKKFVDKKFEQQTDFILNRNKKIGVNFIGKIEQIQNDFNSVCKQIKIPEVKLSTINSTEHKHYTEYYNDNTRQIIADKFVDDINNFNYAFGD